MSDERSFLALVHYTRKIKKKNSRVEIRFSSKEFISVFLRFSTTLVELQNSILQKLGVANSKWVSKLFYRFHIAVVSEHVKYGPFVIQTDADLEVIFHCRRDFPEIRTTNLYVKLEDIIASSGESNPNPSSLHIGGSSSSTPAVSIVPLITPPVASPSFAADLYREDNNTFGELVTAVASNPRHPLWDDDDDESIPVPHRGPSSSESHQYPENFSSLDPEAMAPTHEDNEAGAGFSGGAQWMCKNFGSGCKWLIRVAQCTKKGFWEVRRYNGPHTRLATKVTSDHRQLDYHVICDFIMPMVCVDAVVTIKVLQRN
ncbi:hypothetical protein PIB30_015346 [Stylosanthes scabra]|uniref:Transposase MuDR plant domain-containing protein n=1 Tax=Stylosanthes scabra TaxID=79078 RepID=A0ABU6R7A0_9FABA|nr:hypothetical protein [Stylosanthes scabra]